MYKIIFDDNTEFLGGDLKNSLWNEMPDKFIKEFQYYLNGKTLYLSGYDAYNHEIEKIVLMNDKKIICNSIILSAKEKDKVLRIIIDIRTGYISTKWKDFNTLNISGWKKGLYSKRNSCTWITDKSQD